VGYRIIKLDSEASNDLNRAEVVQEFDSAYRAMARMKSAFLGSEREKALTWYLIDMHGEVLARPQDIYDLASEAAS
jgi:hypothetical protein